MNTDTAASQLQALGNPIRLRICEIVVKAGDGGVTVGRIQSALKINASTLSHHLKTLTSAGLLTQTRDATKLICRVNDGLLHGLLDSLTRRLAA
jgi:ArsR family transcriptional regulator